MLMLAASSTLLVSIHGKLDVVQMLLKTGLSQSVNYMEFPRILYLAPTGINPLL